MERRCVEKCNISRSAYLSKFHQILHLRRKSDPWTSPSTAPATTFWLKKTSVQEKPSRVLLQSKVADLSPETAAPTLATLTISEAEPSSAWFWRRPIIFMKLPGRWCRRLDQSFGPSLFSEKVLASKCFSSNSQGFKTISRTGIRSLGLVGFSFSCLNPSLASSHDIGKRCFLLIQNITKTSN